MPFFVRSILLGLMLSIVVFFLIAVKNFHLFINSSLRSYGAVAILKIDINDKDILIVKEKMETTKGVLKTNIIEVASPDIEPEVSNLISRGIIKIPPNINYSFKNPFSKKNPVIEINKNVLQIEGVREIVFDQKGFDKVLAFVKFLNSCLRVSSLIIFTLLTLVFFLTIKSDGKSLQYLYKEWIITAILASLIALMLGLLGVVFFPQTAEFNIVYFGKIEFILLLIFQTIWLFSIFFIKNRVNLKRS